MFDTLLQWVAHLLTSHRLTNSLSLSCYNMFCCANVLAVHSCVCRTAAPSRSICLPSCSGMMLILLISILWPRISISCTTYSYIVATIKFFFWPCLAQGSGRIKYVFKTEVTEVTQCRDKWHHSAFYKTLYHQHDSEARLFQDKKVL